MSFPALIISLCLHVGVALLVLFWPSAPPVKLEGTPVQISLMEGAPGGNRAPSPVLGPQGAPGQEKPAPSMPAPKADVPGPVAEEKAAPIAAPKGEERKGEEKPLPKPEPKPETKKEPVREAPKPEPKADAVPEKKKPEKDTKKDAPKPAPKAETKKDTRDSREKGKPDGKEQSKNTKSGSKDAVAEALRNARRRAGSQESSPDRGSATERALAEARRRASGHNGGGGGEGDGVGGGGLLDVYLGQVMMAVRPNWGYASSSRKNMSCQVHVVLDAEGGLLKSELVRSSGNAQFDASAVNAVLRTGKNGQFPPPPNADYRELDLVFNLSDLR